jgi:hypothetical protein
MAQFLPSNSVPLPSSHSLPFELNRLTGAIKSTTTSSHPVLKRLNNRHRLIRGEFNMPLPTLLRRHKRVVELRQQPADGNEDHGQVGDDEADDVAGVVAHGGEGRVREAEDDGEDGDGDVAE